jgi:hypothetical protein
MTLRVKWVKNAIGDEFWGMNDGNRARIRRIPGASSRSCSSVRAQRSKEKQRNAITIAILFHMIHVIHVEVVWSKTMELESFPIPVDSHPQHFLPQKFDLNPIISLDILGMRHDNNSIACTSSENSDMVQGNTGSGNETHSLRQERKRSNRHENDWDMRFGMPHITKCHGNVQNKFNTYSVHNHTGNLWMLSDPWVRKSDYKQHSRCPEHD